MNKLALWSVRIGRRQGFLTEPSGLLYRVRFVVFVTAMCIVGFTVLLATVNDSLTQQPEFCVIYVSGLVVLALCLISMIRRVRGLADYFACGR